jgi:hypothetical protein
MLFEAPPPDTTTSTTRLRRMYARLLFVVVGILGRFVLI